MRVSGRILSLVLSVVMLASVCLAAVSCKVSKGEIKKVQETDPWYEAKRVELDPEFDASKTKNLKVKGPYLIRDKYIMSYVAGEIWDDLPAIYTVPHQWMGIYDKDGNRTHMIDVDEIMQQYTSSAALTRIKTTNLGSLNRLTYDITLKEPGTEKALIDALRCRNGNLEISMSLSDADASEL